jgi:hypothetical protein
MSDLPIEESKGSTEYTPGLMEIRDAVTDWLGVDAFDRWLTAHDAELVRVRDERIAAALKELDAVADHSTQAERCVYAILSGGDPDGE